MLKNLGISGCTKKRFQFHLRLCIKIFSEFFFQPIYNLIGWTNLSVLAMFVKSRLPAVQYFPFFLVYYQAKGNLKSRPRRLTQAWSCNNANNPENKMFMAFEVRFLRSWAGILSFLMSILFKKVSQPIIGLHIGWHVIQRFYLQAFNLVPGFLSNL